MLHGGSVLKPWLLIDSSTIDPQSSRKLSEIVSECTSDGKKGNRIKFSQRHIMRIILSLFTLISLYLHLFESITSLTFSELLFTWKGDEIALSLSHA